MLTRTSSGASVLVLIASFIGASPAVSQTPVDVQILSDGAVMQGRFYDAHCDSACPTLMLVPGHPGGTEDVLGLGSRLSPHGINVLMFNPRGHHQSEGTFTFFNTLDDIGAAFNWLHDARNGRRFSIDTSSIAIGGYSFGGGMSMAYAARDPRVNAVVSIAGTDHAEIIREYQRNASLAAFLDRILRESQAPSGPVHFDVEASKRELKENQEVFGLRENAARLADRRILLIGGWEDVNITIEQYMLPLYRALKTAGAEDVTFVVYPDDHGFGQSRARLADDVRNWLRQSNRRHTSLEENKQIVRRVTAAGVNTGNLEVFREMLARDYARHSQATTGMEEIRGVDDMLEFLQAHFTAFPDWHEEIELMIAEGDKVAYITTGTGTQTGPMGSAPPTGKTMEVVTFAVHRIQNGKIAETWVGWDNLAVLSQLGLLALPGSNEK